MSSGFRLSDNFIDGKPNLGSLCLPDGTFETPCLVVSTYIGGVHYTTPDCLGTDLHADCNCLGQLEISDIVRKDFDDIPLSALRSWNQPTILSGRNVVFNVATTDSTGINIDSFNGRIHIGVNDYAKRITLDKPSAVVAFADEVCIF